MRSLRHTTLAALLAASCASAPEPQPEESKLDPNWRPGSTRLPGSEEDDGMTLENAKGALDQRDVDRVLDKQVQSLTPCYEQAGPAQKYAGGDVKLRFFVTKTGEVSNVLVVESAVGNYEVERCLVTEGRRLKFPPPRGEHATDFEYSLRFQASGNARVVEWGDGVLDRDVAQLTQKLAACGSLGKSPVRAVVYIQPGGTVASVGLACGGPMDVEASACAVEQIRKWRLKDDRQHMVRAAFMVGSAGAAPPPPPAARARPAKRSTPRRRG
jgi:TonB family protein